MADFPRKGKGGGDDYVRGNKKTVVKQELVEITEPRCKVCKSPYRHDMEEALLRGMSYTQVGKFFEKLGQDVNRKNLASHEKNHMNLANAALRNVLEKRAREALVNVEETEGLIMTKMGMLDAMLHKVWEQIINDNIEWKPGDVLQIMQYIEKLEAQQRNIALDEIMLEARCFSEAVKSIVPQSQWQEIVDRFDANVARAKNPMSGIEMKSLES
jgi:hypothetical protein